MRRVEGWMADLAGRLASRRSESSEKLRARRERRAQGFTVGYRFTDWVGVRRERLTEKLRARRERRAQGFTVGYRFTDWVGVRRERLTDRYRARRKRLSGQRAERGRQGVARRSAIILSGSICVMLVVTMGFLIHTHMSPPELSNAASAKPFAAAARGIDIPDVRGMPASEARVQLERAGLKLAGARAVLGAPGQVLWTQPNIGRSVPAGTPVTIVIGVEAERL
jgi:hypothetical protein